MSTFSDACSHCVGKLFAHTTVPFPPVNEWAKAVSSAFTRSGGFSGGADACAWLTQR